MTNMADDDQDARIRVQRDSGFKDLNVAFDKHAHSLNKAAREVQFHFTLVPIDVKAVKGLSEQYKSIVDSVSSVFERIVDLSEGTPPRRLSPILDVLISILASLCQRLVPKFVKVEVMLA